MSDINTEISSLLTESDTWLSSCDLPDTDNLVTEDDTPVDNIFSEKQQRLLTEPLYTSWNNPDMNKSFLVLANVGLFYAVRKPPLVPDVMLSMDIQTPEDVWLKQNRSYFIWEYGKPPDVVIEIVSNLKGGENNEKKEIYARIGVSYYVIFDPAYQLSNHIIQGFELSAHRTYLDLASEELSFSHIGLGLILWCGRYEGMEASWLRWCDLNGNLILTGAETSEQEFLRAEKEKQRAENAEAELARLAARLKELGL